MWIQCTLSRDDFTRALNALLPLRIQIDPGSDSGGVIYLGKPRQVSLVPQRGVRLQARGRIRWPVLGVTFPVTLREVQIVLEPRIVGRGRQQRLAFVPVVEQADAVAVPGFLGHELVPRLNKRFASPGAELAWRFVQTLQLEAPLPEQFDPVRRLGLHASWGAVRVTREAVTLALSLRLKVTRERLRSLEIADFDMAPAHASFIDPSEASFVGSERPVIAHEGSLHTTIDGRSGVSWPPFEPDLAEQPAEFPLHAAPLSRDLDASIVWVDDSLDDARDGSFDDLRGDPLDELHGDGLDAPDLVGEVTGPASAPVSDEEISVRPVVIESPPAPYRPTIDTLSSAGELPPLAVEPTAPLHAPPPSASLSTTLPSASWSAPSAPLPPPSAPPTSARPTRHSAADLFVRFAAPPEMALGVVPPVPNPDLPPEVAAGVQAATSPPSVGSGPVEVDEEGPISRVA